MVFVFRLLRNRTFTVWYTITTGRQSEMTFGAFSIPFFSFSHHLTPYMITFTIAPFTKMVN